MIIDLKHNKIIEATMTEAFARSFEEKVIPALTARYGKDISLVQMYEDHIADGFSSGGDFYYPLTLIRNGETVTQWIKWKLAKGEFDEKSPYAFLGGNLKFALADTAPRGFEDKLAGRARLAEGKFLKINIQMMARDITFLSGRYSQTFVDEMARQLTPAIEKAMSVEGIADSPLELCLVFSPESYMEHTSENVTYRRLLMTDKNGAPKDFWIKWTRLDGATAYNVSANVSSANILFEIGEDVSQKIREKEYRFLLNAKGKDKYHNAMGRKNITEWRDIIKRLLKKGELTRVELDAAISEETEELTRTLASVIGVSEPVSGSETVASPESDEELLKILEFARETLRGEQTADTDPEEEELSEEDGEELTELEDFYKEEDEAPLISFDGDEDKDELAKAARETLSTLDLSEVDFGDSEDIEDDYDGEEELDAEAEYDLGEELGDGIEEKLSDDRPIEDATASASVIVPEDPCEEEYFETEHEAEQSYAEEAHEAEEQAGEKPGKEEPSSVADIEEKIRKEVEAKLRLEYERDARRRAEEEAERLRKENEKLQDAKRKQDDLRLAEERARAEETERLRAQIEAQLRAESRERERLAEAARAAVEEQRRLEVEKAKIERMRLEEERRLEAERQARAVEAERAREVERIKRETEERIRAEYEARRAEQERAAKEAERIRELEHIKELERIKAEREALEKEAALKNAAAESAAPAAEELPAEPEAEQEPEINPNYTYTSKVVKLLFRRSVDPNIIARIQEIVKATLDYYGKSKMYLKIQATIPDSQTVMLNFLKIPMEEKELLGNIIKVLGNSGLGIAKAILVE